MKVKVGSKLMGEELYGAMDPESYKKWLGKEVTVKGPSNPCPPYLIEIEEERGIYFYMEEIECIIEEEDIVESDEPFTQLLGGVV